MWLLKTEPTVYSYASLEKEGRTVWDGVTNPVALKNMKAMKTGDRVFIYHTGDVKAVIGIAEVVREANPDPKAASPRLVVIDIKAVRVLNSPVTLTEIKSMPLFAESPLVRQGRLSVVPLTAPQWKAIEAKGAK